MKKVLSTRLRKALGFGLSGVLLIFALALIPLDLFVVSVPSFLPVLLSVAGLAGLAVCLILSRTRLVTKILLPVLCTVLAVVCSAAPYCIPYWNSYSLKAYNGPEMNYDEELSLKEALEDLGAVRKYLKRVHPMYLHGLTDEFEQNYAAAEARLRGMEKITVNDLRREIQLVLHPMSDAHTTTYNSYPGDRYLRVAPQRMSEGYSLLTVNGRTAEELREAAKPYFCYESEDWISVDCGSFASLEFYGLDQFPMTFVWENGDGETATDVCERSDFVPLSEYLELRDRYVSVSGEDRGQSFVSYRLDEEHSLAVLTLTQCNYNAEYIDCVRRMFTEVKARGIRNVAVDLRGNGGGNSMVANELIRYLPTDAYNDCASDMRLGPFSVHVGGACKNRRYTDLTFIGSVFVLTDHRSFSSAMDFAMLIQDNELGEVIGESPANAVNGYGDVAAFRLPNSGLFLQVSIKKWYRADPSDPDPFVIPDHPCDGGSVFEELYRVLK